METIQTYPTTDSVPTDAFEGLVAAYYQLQGHITSSNKWFWVWEEGKRQRGYQDIDVLAIKADKTVIVSVTANLDDKVRRARDGLLRKDMLDELNTYFERARAYLESVGQYAWLVDSSRQVRKVVAFASGDGLANRIRDEVGTYGIQSLSAGDIVRYLQKEAAKRSKHGLKTNNQLIKLVQLIAQYSQGTPT
jgi:hypothetical protein